MWLFNFADATAGLRDLVFIFFSAENPVRRLVWGRLFGQCVGKTREAAGRSVAEAAHLAGMETSEWSAVEAGFVPDPSKLRPMADALELRYDRIATMAVLCRDAWE